MAIREVRNTLAHAERALGFASPEIIKKARLLRRYKHAGARKLFDAAVSAAEVEISDRINKLTYEHATRP
jgi:hypothetical protein